MKKEKILCFLLAACFLAFGCKNEKQQPQNSSAVTENKPVPQKLPQKASPVLKTGADNLVSFESLQEFFTPDYTPQLPETFSKNNTKLSDKKAKNDKTEKSEAIIPGLRQLSDYVAQYTSKRLSMEDYNKQKDFFSVNKTDGETPEQFTKDNNKFFLIEDWGTQKTIVSEAEFPSFYVVFNKPVHQLSALDAPTSQSPVMTITPAIKGTFRWYGSQHLSFEAEEPANPATEYVIKINKDTTSLSGERIRGQLSYRTKAQPVSIEKMYGGYMGKGESAYSSVTGALPPYENKILLILNYQISKEQCLKLITLSANNKVIKYDAEPVLTNNTDDFMFFFNEPKFDAEKQTTNQFILTIKDVVEHNTKIVAKAKDDVKTRSYMTLKPFKISSFPEYTTYSQGAKINPLYISFTQNIEKSTLKDKLILDQDFQITEEYYEINGSQLVLFNLPVNFGESHSITFGQDIKDTYGQKLQLTNSTFEFKVRDAMAYIKFLDYGAKMLEAQFPHKMIFEYQNLEPNSYYKISATEHPLNFTSEFIETSDTLPQNAQEIPEIKKNTRQFVQVDFDPYLTNGYGFVKFDSLTRHYEENYWSDELELKTNTHVMTVQVTDLGVTARIGINKAVFMVRSLSTGKPVPDATVNIVLYPDDKPYANPYASGKTDSNGLCVINFTQNQIQQYEKASKDRYWSEVYRIYVTNGDDKAVFVPDSHNAWREGVSTGYRAKVRKPIQRTFMFVDRGLYKPGETVTFRGIDRNQLLGTIKAHQGNYTIKVSGGWWNAPEIITPITGITSESGGFYGSFQLPEDLEPGSYEIKFTRDDVTDPYQNAYCYFTVAEFERLKIQASVSTPEITFFGGDKLSAQVAAEYLASGSLNGADYRATWFTQNAVFTPDTIETQHYSFGPSNNYSSRTHYSDDQGKLSANGEAQLACNSEKITNGQPRNYRVEVSVTDVSNQSITTTGNIFVHPAQYYVGLKMPSNLHGFATKNTAYDFSYILVKPDGSLLETNQLSSKVETLNYTLKRDVWTLVHEQSVDNAIYTRYQKTTETEASGSVVTATSGLIKITPENTGWYTLEVRGTDAKGNPVFTDLEFYVSGKGMFWHGTSDSTEIALTPNQKEYNPGDKAQILMESPLPSGDYLITVEREGIFTEEIRHFDEPATIIEIPIATNYLPVVYVSVSSYSERTGQPTHEYGEPDLNKPKDYYGVCPLFVNPFVRAFSVQVECDQPTYKPGEKATITLTATKGNVPVENAELTLMAVDRGVLDLIDYHVPNPIDFFYKASNFPLYVQGGDSRAYLMDPVTYSIKNLQGGDADAASEEEKEEERKDFRPTALFEPALITDKNGKVTCTFVMPDSLTTYRITAFGVKNDLFALQEEEIKVQNPINVQQVQPRRLRERDTAECGVLITNLHKKGQKVKVSVEARTPEGNTFEDEAAGRKTVPGQAFIDGPAEHTVYVASGDSTVVYFDVSALSAGTVELVYHIQTEDSSLLKERLVSPIKIEQTYVYETVTLNGTTGNPTGRSEKTKTTEAIVLPGFAKNGRGDLSITLDATRLGMLGSSVNYLFRYPYGCLEQQSSSVLPLLLFGDYIDVFGLDSEIYNIKSCICSFTKQWAKCQHPDGGFPYWPDRTESSFFVSLRLAHIYALGLEKGYTKEELSYDIKALTDYIAENIKDTSDYQKAYACYVLKLLGNNSLDSTLTQLYKKADELPLSTMALVSLAYSKDDSPLSKEKAKEINKKIRGYLQPVERSVTILDTNRSNSIWIWYESPSTQMALILKALVEVNPADTMVDRLLFTLMQKQKKGYWNNTISTANVLDAIDSYIKKRNLEDTNYIGKVSLNNHQLMEENFEGLGTKPRTLKLPFEAELLSDLSKDTAYPVVFEKQGAGQLYYTVEMKYALPDEMQLSRDEGIKVSYEIYDYDTEELINKASEDSTLFLESGKLYKAKIRLETHRDRTYLALRAPIPSGAEILDSTFVTTGSAAEITNDSSSWGHWLSNKTIHDNEIHFFWNNFRTGSSTVSFTFRASRRGVYPTPPVQAECMYEPEIFGRSDGYLVEIK